MTITEAAGHLGERVEYRRPGVPDDTGTISSVGATLAYVLYDGTRYPKATYPDDLTLLGDDA